MKEGPQTGLHERDPMTMYRVVLPAMEAGGDTPISLEVPSLHLALIAADINLSSGSAEVWDESRMLARVAKKTGGASAYWEVDSRN